MSVLLCKKKQSLASASEQCLGPAYGNKQTGKQTLVKLV